MEEWYYRDQRPLLNANLFLSDSDQMFIITGRPIYLKEVTEKWCKHFYPNAWLVIAGKNALCHSKGDKDKWSELAKIKAEKINDLQLDIYFDDEPETLAELRKLCPNTKIIYYGGRVEL